MHDLNVYQEILYILTHYKTAGWTKGWKEENSNTIELLPAHPEYFRCSFSCYRQESARIIVLALILLPVKIKFFRQELVEEDVSVMHC